MRLWSYQLLPYLPDAQFKGQLRELVAIMHDWKNKGKTNHLLINRVMEYSKADLTTYFCWYNHLYNLRYNKFIKDDIINEFYDFKTPYDVNTFITKGIFNDWHNENYLEICMYNLYEKHLSIGKNRITEKEWKQLLIGYEKITRKKWKT